MQNILRKIFAGVANSHRQRLADPDVAELAGLDQQTVAGRILRRLQYRHTPEAYGVVVIEQTVPSAGFAA